MFKGTPHATATLFAPRANTCLLFAHHIHFTPSPSSLHLSSCSSCYFTSPLRAPQPASAGNCVQCRVPPVRVTGERWCTAAVTRADCPVFLRRTISYPRVRQGTLNQAMAASLSQAVAAVKLVEASPLVLSASSTVLPCPRISTPSLSAQSVAVRQFRCQAAADVAVEDVEAPSEIPLDEADVLSAAVVKVKTGKAGLPFKRDRVCS